MVYAFDFFNTLDTHEWVRALARALYWSGHEVHVVSSISPGLPMDNDAAYRAALWNIKVPFTAIHRVGHDPALKVGVLRKIGADEFWDDVQANVDAASAIGVKAHLVAAMP